MGKGDRKTKKGKISMGSFGVRRPRAKSSSNVAAPVAKPAKKSEPKKKATTAKKKKED